MLAIIRISEWTAALEELLAKSEQEGFHFVRRAKDEWLSEANRFSKDGEALFGVLENACCIAIGGINRKPASCGRLHRYYVRRDERSRGIGRQLGQHVLTFARCHYSSVELRCDTDAADRFYRTLGFSRTAAKAGATQMIDLKKEPPGPTPGGVAAR